MRQLCDRCKTHRKLSEADFAGDPRYSAVGLKIGETIFEPGKCERCGGTGYRGRVGVFEVLQVTEEVRHLINLFELSNQFVIIDRISLSSSNEARLSLNIHVKTLFRDDTGVAANRM